MHEGLPMDSILPPPRLLDRVRQKIRRKGYAQSTEDTYAAWVKRYILFHGKRHPDQLGMPEIEAFLSHLANRHRMSAATQNQALAALLFLYREVLERPVDGGVEATRAKRHHHLPTVLSVEETRRLLGAMSGTLRLMAELTYGAGLRVSETHRLRVGDLDFATRRILVRDGKGRKDRFSLLPTSLVRPLQQQLLKVRALHARDLASGYGASVTPRAYAGRTTHASRAFAWQFAFPSATLFHDARTGLHGRWHVHVSTLQKAVQRAAAQAGLDKRVSVHALRHSFATHLLAGGCDIRRVQLLLGHAHVNTTMVYAHIVDAQRWSVASPLDAFHDLPSAA